MQMRTALVCSAVAAAGAGFLFGHFAFEPLLKLGFPAFVARLGMPSPEQLSQAMLQSGVALALMAALLPVSALVTEKFAAKAGYPAALVKSAVVLALVLILTGFYQSEMLASQQRVFERLPTLFPNGLPPTNLDQNPLTRMFWIGALFLLLFGPLDLWIARQQLQYRSRGRDLAQTGTESSPEATHHA